MFNSSFVNIFLVGRPNVGKSSIFNFLISNHEAFVNDEDGTTVDWRSKTIGNIVLWDSPGIFKFQGLPVAPDYIYFVIEHLVLDADKKLYLELKAKFKNILVIVNKIDKGEDVNYSFFDNHIKISLRSRFNIFQLKSLFMDHYIATPSNDKKLWAVIGKPNVGKSSLINALLGFNLHKIEDFEGTTKEFLPVDFNDNVLLDSPGQRNGAFFPKYRNVFGIIVVTDLKNEKQDLRLINLAFQRNKPILLVINKIDLLSNKKAIAEIRDRFYRLFCVPILFISCLRSIGLPLFFDTLKSLEANYSKRIPTHLLNNWLQESIKKIEPRLKFISQVEIAFPKFYINCFLTKDKEIMLKRRLTERFDFLGIPVKIIYK